MYRIEKEAHPGFLYFFWSFLFSLFILKVCPSFSHYKGIWIPGSGLQKRVALHKAWNDDFKPSITIMNNNYLKKWQSYWTQTFLRTSNPALGSKPCLNSFKTGLVSMLNFRLYLDIFRNCSEFFDLIIQLWKTQKTIE